MAINIVRLMQLAIVSGDISSKELSLIIAIASWNCSNVMYYCLLNLSMHFICKIYAFLSTFLFNITGVPLISQIEISPWQ